LTPQQIKTRLESAYPDGKIEVVDLTGTHDHYQVMIESSAFTGLSRLQCQRHVMAVFDAELKTGEVHALTIKTTAVDAAAVSRS
jgi:stress-induced morphogen